MRVVFSPCPCQLLLFGCLFENSHSDGYEVISLAQCWSSIILQKQMNRQTQKEIRFMVPRGRGYVVGSRMNAVKRYKLPVTRLSTKDVMCNMINIIKHCCMLYMKVVKTVNPKSCHHKEKYFVLFLELHMYISW